MNEIEQELANISKKLDQIEIELNMNIEALESIEISARLLKAELDYLADEDSDFS
jgi:hypothetical protein